MAGDEHLSASEESVGGKQISFNKDVSAEIHSATGRGEKAA
jgi:hypothetical protein